MNIRNFTTQERVCAGNRLLLSRKVSEVMDMWNRIAFLFHAKVTFLPGIDRPFGPLGNWAQIITVTIEGDCDDPKCKELIDVLHLGNSDRLTEIVQREDVAARLGGPDDLHYIGDKLVAYSDIMRLEDCARKGDRYEAIRIISELSGLGPSESRYIVDNYRGIDFKNPQQIPQSVSNSSSDGCYVATAVYGSYDCPQVWTLRRFRDYTLAETWYGRVFIHTYYAISPTLVKWFGHTDWFKHMWKGTLDRMVANLNASGVENTPYEDKAW